MKRAFLLLSTFLLVFGTFYGQKNVNFTIKQNAETGEVISGLPTSLIPGDTLKFQLYFDPSYKTKEVTKLLDNHFTTYEKIGKLIKTNNKGILFLKDNKGKIRDYVYFDKNGYQNNNASYTRIPNQKGFQVHPEINGKRFSIGTQAKSSPIVISELIIDPVSANIDSDGSNDLEVDDQMIELLNLGTSTLNIGNWEILINGVNKHKIAVGTNLKPSEAKSIIKNFDFSRYQSAVKISLLDNNKNIVDEVNVRLPLNKTYKDKRSLTRTFKNGNIIFDTYDNAGTTNTADQKFTKDKSSIQNLSGHLTPDDVLINEVFINPVIDLNGDKVVDSNDSYIEIANYSVNEQQLDGWKLYNGSKLLHTFSNSRLESGELKTVFGGGASLPAINANPAGLSFDESMFSTKELDSLQKRIKEEINRIMDSANGTYFIRSNGNDWIFDWEKYDRKRDELFFPDRTNTNYTASTVPDFTTLFSREYELRIIYYNAKGQIINEDIQKLPAVDLATLPNPAMTNGQTKNLLKSFNSIGVGNYGAEELVYELRLINPYLDYLNSKSSTSVRKKSFQMLNQKPLDNTTKKYIQQVKNRNNGLSEYDIEQLKIAVKRDLKLYELEVHSNSQLNSWLMDWLWYNKGELMLNPFNTANLDLELKPITKKIKELKTRISKSEGIYSIRIGNDPDKFHLFKDPIDLEDYSKKEIALKKKINAIKSLQSRDQLLYRGRMMVSPSKTNINKLMRHHDANNEYVSWKENDTKEVTENQQLNILVENEKPSVSNLITISETNIDTDETLIQEDAAASQANNSLEFNELKTKQYFYNNDFAYTLPISTKRDTSPDLQTTSVPYQSPITAPSNVSYTIKAGVKGSEKDVVTGKYRNNKLHRVRLKAGLLYSFLKLQTIDTTGISPTRETKDFGIDGTFGFQIYFKRTDIRKLGVEFRNGRSVAPFLYLGFSMKSLQDNLYTGIGFEPISGVSIMGGLHLGQRNEIEQIDNEPVIVGEELGVNAFGSIVIDLNVLTRVFGLASAIPFD